jgi:hypothetical protein
MEVTFGGIVMLVRLVQPTNVCSSIVVTKGGIVKLVKLEQFAIHAPPIVLIVGGNETLVRFDQPLNAFPSMLVTVYVAPLITKLSNTVSEVDVGLIPPLTSAVPNPILYT